MNDLMTNSGSSRAQIKNPRCDGTNKISITWIKTHLWFESLLPIHYNPTLSSSAGSYHDSAEKSQPQVNMSFTMFLRTAMFVSLYALLFHHVSWFVILHLDLLRGNLLSNWPMTCIISCIPFLHTLDKCVHVGNWPRQSQCWSVPCCRQCSRSSCGRGSLAPPRSYCLMERKRRGS